MARREVITAVDPIRTAIKKMDRHKRHVAALAAARFSYAIERGQSSSATDVAVDEIRQVLWAIGIEHFIGGTAP